MYLRRVSETSGLTHHHRLNGFEPRGRRVVVNIHHVIFPVLGLVNFKLSPVPLCVPDLPWIHVTSLM